MWPFRHVVMSNHVSKYHLLALGTMGTLTHTMWNWNAELKAGLGFQIAWNIVAGVACLIFYSCVSELTSAFPFPGGSYAFTRCTVGFFPGYVVGCLEVLYYILSMTLATLSIITNFRTEMNGLDIYGWIIALLLVVSQFCICLSKRWMYNFLLVLVIYGVILNVAYIVGAIRLVQCNQWAYLPRQMDDNELQLWVTDDDGGYVAEPVSNGVMFSPQYLRTIQAIAPILWTYKSIEYVNLMCDDVEVPRKAIPFAQLVGFWLLAVLHLGVVIVGPCMYPGIARLSRVANPTNAGFAEIFGVSHHAALALVMPIKYGAGVVVFYATGKLLSSMADSYLLPRMLRHRMWSSRMPVRALFVAGVASLIALFLTVAFDKTSFIFWNDIIGELVLVTYCVQLISFIILRVKLTAFPRDYVSPFGSVGAVFAFLVFLSGIGSGLVHQVKALSVVAVTAVYLLIMSLYYFYHAKHVQTFSLAEKAVILPAHAEIRNANGLFIVQIVFSVCFDLE